MKGHTMNVTVAALQAAEAAAQWDVQVPENRAAFRLRMARAQYCALMDATAS
jgi:hypothetical protein